MSVRLVRPAARHEAAFLAAVARSRRLHRPWVSPPDDAEAFRAWVRRVRRATHASWLALDGETGEPAGALNASEIVRGAFQSAYLGYYALEPHAGRGLMTAALAAALDECFGALALHRVEANVQPGNVASLALVRRLGFRREGFSPRYLRIGGRWRDHERWALLAEEWRGSAARRDACAS